MGLIQFTANYSDHSNENGYQFEFFCDKCHNGHMTTFRANKLGMAGGFLRAASSLFGGALGNVANAADHVKDSLRGQARDDAFNEAVQEAKPHFRQCSRCGHWVCPEHCWNAKRNLCEECAPDLEEAAASIQARVAVEQLETMARESDQTGGMSMNSFRTAAKPTCPHCGIATEGGKFCAGCGKPLAAREKFCAQCGTKLNPSSRFCAECGTPAGA